MRSSSTESSESSADGSEKAPENKRYKNIKCGFSVGVLGLDVTIASFRALILFSASLSMFLKSRLSFFDSANGPLWTMYIVGEAFNLYSEVVETSKDVHNLYKKFSDFSAEVDEYRRKPRILEQESTSNNSFEIELREDLEVDEDSPLIAGRVRVHQTGFRKTLQSLRVSSYPCLAVYLLYRNVFRIALRMLFIGTAITAGALVLSKEDTAAAVLFMVAYSINLIKNITYLSCNVMEPGCCKVLLPPAKIAVDLLCLSAAIGFADKANTFGRVLMLVCWTLASAGKLATTLWEPLSQAKVKTDDLCCGGKLALTLWRQCAKKMSKARGVDNFEYSRL